MQLLIIDNDDARAVTVLDNLAKNLPEVTRALAQAEHMKKGYARYFYALFDAPRLFAAVDAIPNEDENTAAEFVPIWLARNGYSGNVRVQLMVVGPQSLADAIARTGGYVQ